jgi:hypothetical protein
MRKIKLLIASTAVAGAMLASLTAGACSAGARPAPRRDASGAGVRHSRKSRSHKPAVVRGPRGAAGPAGPAGPAGAQGPKGETGAAGAQGPGAVEYVYNSTAPAGTEQNTPLGQAGPFALTGNCLQLGPSLIEVAINAVNKAPVQLDDVHTESDEGSPALIWFSSLTQSASPNPEYLFGVTSTSAGDKESYASGRLTITAPVHGELEVFAYASEATNVCHVSTVWIPAS